MSRLTNYLTEIKEIRSKMLTEQEAIDIINKNCSIILDKYKRHPDWKIYRGLKLAGNWIFTDPAKGQPRHSKGRIGDYYTLLMDNLPNWKKYPKRSRSIICTTSQRDAKTYGSVYVVFPFNNANFGVCQDSDIWLGFKNSIGNLRIFVRDLKNILETTLSKSNLKFDKDWNTLTKAFKESEEYIKSDKIPDTILNSYKQNFHNWINDIGNGKTYINTFMNYMSPSKNKFALTKDPTNVTRGRELWTDSKCVLVYERLVNQILGVEDD